MDRGTAAVYRYRTVTTTTHPPQSSGFAFCCACLLCMRALQTLPSVPGCKDARPSEQLDLWAVRLVSPLADSACSRNRPSSQLRQGRTMSPDPTVVRSSPTCGLTTRWDWAGLAEWMACCASVTLRAAPLSASARGLSLVSSLQRAWFLGLGPFSKLHALPGVHCQSTRLQIYNALVLPTPTPSYTRICSHLFLTHAHMNQRTQLHPSKRSTSNR